MTDERRRDRDGPGVTEERPAEPATTILARLLGNLRTMAQVYGLVAARDLRLAVRDTILAVVLFSTVLMFGLYLVGLAIAASVLALALIMPAWAATLVVLGGSTLVTGLMVLLMVVLMRRIAGRMRTIMQALKEDARWLRTRILRID